MDAETQNMMKAYGLEGYISVLQGQDIDHEALLALNPESKEVEQLFPKIGPRVKFQKALRAYLAIMRNELDGPSKHEVHSNASNSHNVRKWQYDQMYEDDNLEYNANARSPNADDMAENIIQPIVNSIMSNESMYGEDTFYSQLQNLNLDKLLHESVVGQVILARYAREHDFEEKERRQLVDVIVAFLLSKTNALGQPYQCKNTHFNDLANKIIALFPTEYKAVYFVAPFSEGPKQKVAKGKLCDAYRNRLRQHRLLGMFPTRKRKLDTTTPSTETPPLNENSKNICLEHLEWLNQNCTPWSSVIEHWEASRPLRLKIIEEKNGDLSAIFESWPILKQPLGYTLLERDYSSVFGDEVELQVEWPEFSRKLEKLMHTDIKNKSYLPMLNDVMVNNYSSEAKDTVILRLLPALCPPTARIRLANNGYWKPSIQESMDGFMLHIKSQEQLLQDRERHRALMADRKTPACPFVIIVGPEISSIQESYVNIDEMLYKVESPLRAVEICYKVFHALNISYPPESVQVWLLLQRYLFKTITNRDKQIKCVLNMTNKLDKA